MDNDGAGDPVCAAMDKMEDLFVPGTAGQQGRGATVKCGEYLRALTTAKPKAKDVLVVFARHLKASGTDGNVTSAYPEGWEGLTKTAAKAGLYKELALKYPSVGRVVFMSMLYLAAFITSPRSSHRPS